METQKAFELLLKYKKYHIQHALIKEKTKQIVADKLK